MLVVVLALGAGWWTLSGGTAAASDNDARSLADLQLLIAQPDADADLWRQYALRLQEDKQFDHAAQAYERVLQFDPYDRPAKLQCASVLALAGNAERLAQFMKQVIMLDPKLAVDIFTRPEMQTYLADSRFVALSQEAKVQSMD